MFGLSAAHLLIFLFIVLLFGYRRLPELGKALGRGLHAFKKGLEGPHEKDPSLLKEEPIKTEESLKKDATK